VSSEYLILATGPLATPSIRGPAGFVRIAAASPTAKKPPQPRDGEAPDRRFVDMRVEIGIGTNDELGWTIICWANLSDIWHERGLAEHCNAIDDLAYDCPAIVISDISDEDYIPEEDEFDEDDIFETYYEAYTDDPAAALRELRDGTARLLRKYREVLKEIREVRQEERQVAAARAKAVHKKQVEDATITDEMRDHIVEIVDEVYDQLVVERKPSSGIEANVFEFGSWDKKYPEWTSEGATRVCTSDVASAWDYLDHECQFQRKNLMDLLWVRVEHVGSRVITLTRDADPHDNCVRLFLAMLLSLIGIGWPMELDGCKLVPKVRLELAMSELDTRLRQRLKGNEEKYSTAEIVETARSLGLDPSPVTGSESAWESRCPGTNHSIHISPKSNSFGCGYCRVKGGPEELVAFAKRRK